MYMDDWSPEIWGIQSSSINSTNPNPVNCILFTQVIIKYFENAILTLTVSEFEFKRTAVEKKFLFKVTVCLSHIYKWGWSGGWERERGTEMHDLENVL